jgi:hypothetical protein
MVFSKLKEKKVPKTTMAGKGKSKWEVGGRVRK